MTELNIAFQNNYITNSYNDIQSINYINFQFETLTQIEEQKKEAELKRISNDVSQFLGICTFDTYKCCDLDKNIKKSKCNKNEHYEVPNLRNTRHSLILNEHFGEGHKSYYNQGSVIHYDSLCEKGKISLVYYGNDIDQFEKYVRNIKSNNKYQYTYSSEFIHDNNFIHIIDNVESELDEDDGWLELIYSGKKINEFKQCFDKLQKEFTKMTLIISPLHN